MLHLHTNMFGNNRSRKHYGTPPSTLGFLRWIQYKIMRIFKLYKADNTKLCCKDSLGIKYNVLYKICRIQTQLPPKLTVALQPS